MRADIRNKDTDTEYKRGLLRYEPWKILVGGIAAGAGLMEAATALAAFVLSHIR